MAIILLLSLRRGGKNAKSVTEVGYGKPFSLKTIEGDEVSSTEKKEKKRLEEKFANRKDRRLAGSEVVYPESYVI